MDETNLPDNYVKVLNHHYHAMLEALTMIYKHYKAKGWTEWQLAQLESDLVLNFTGEYLAHTVVYGGMGKNQMLDGLYKRMDNRIDAMKNDPI